MANETHKRKSRVFLVDNHPLVRRQLAALLQTEAGLEVCAALPDEPAAVSLIARQRPDLVILDASSRGSHGLDLLRNLNDTEPKLPVLIVSMHEETTYAERALRAGARGYLTREEATSNVLLAVRKVLAGEIYLSERMAGRMRAKASGVGVVEVGSPLEVLTEREWEVFQMLGRGLGTRRIAEKLGLPIRIVEAYRARIGEKLQVADGDELQQRATQWALKSPGGPPGSAANTKAQGPGTARPDAAENGLAGTGTRQTTLPSHEQAPTTRDTPP